ncbi:unnamed protein product [Cylicocyclus nassatus]|uniref:C-type lectin domain-containing protein n=1 Tax=Cylicocyclus nassatus TaxID=53992 RepID=A0AA36M8G8_CYLNA|nr:unnamed protein product [Cylicocyclus nassatus]
MKLLLFALLPLVQADISPNNSKAACPDRCSDGWTYFIETHACYKNFFNANFEEAESWCSFNGGHLASIHHAKENWFVAELAKMGKKCSDIHDMTWIGLREGPEKDKWTWTDGTKLDYNSWASNSPDPKWKEGKRCVLLSSDTYVDSWTIGYQEWTDTRCSEKIRSFVCKKMPLH